MRRFVLSLAIVIASSTASAEPAPSSVPTSVRPLALALNLPVAWPWSLAASAWVGLDNYDAIRVNYARYRGPIWAFIAGSIFSEGLEEGDVPPDFGHTTDLSVAWVHYPRRVLDGASFEVGALCRLHRLRDRIDLKNVANEERFTNIYSARVLVGWTWRLSDWWFLAMSVGASSGYERGREKTFVGYTMGMEITKDARVSRGNVAAEAYLRVGVAFSQ
jgi:hypothetical protein